jgi:hypothetical protein
MTKKKDNDTSKGEYPKRGTQTICAYCFIKYIEWRETRNRCCDVKCCVSCNKKRWGDIITIFK